MTNYQLSGERIQKSVISGVSWTIPSSRGEAFLKKMIFKNGKIYRLKRPSPSWNEVVMTAENPSNGARYHFTLGDYWLILVREIDFDGDWHKMIDFLKRNKVPSREQKLKLIQRLMEISRDANIDSYELVFRKPSSREISKAEQHFFEDDL